MFLKEIICLVIGFFIGIICAIFYTHLLTIIICLVIGITLGFLCTVFYITYYLPFTTHNHMWW